MSAVDFEAATLTLTSLGAELPPVDPVLPRDTGTFGHFTLVCWVMKRLSISIDGDLATVIVCCRLLVTCSFVILAFGHMHACVVFDA